MTYNIVAYPEGKTTLVATLHGLSRRSTQELEFVAMRAGVTVGSELEGIVAHAQVQAKLRGEYVIVLRDKIEVATVGPEGVV